MGDFAADGTVVHSTDLNKIEKVSGVSASLVGSAPTAGASSGYLIQGGTAIVTTNAGGGFSINFPVAFPNGVVTVVAMVGDNTPASDMTCVGIGSSYTKTSWQGVLTSAGALVNTQTCRVNWFAQGF